MLGEDHVALVDTETTVEAARVSEPEGLMTGREVGLRVLQATA